MKKSSHIQTVALPEAHLKVQKMKMYLAISLIYILFLSAIFL
ncbi:hypothetical protein [Christiangramia flava]|uniref:Uncharacterized protein n=1 Tax=Christiangramia flava JLT2011 TaxID=1229726 RepID=A0A1L7I7K7_9FLAO|nr:hypothetical protein [Christiangramia flava]APU69598.1 hypothetical protein GRFL_2874 [Christiangramia flava JLT2011]OSS39371.1 hypothetical protein C723_1917 [Christiangramia flava JLT2011]